MRREINLDELRRLRDAGLSVEAICRELGTTTHFVRRLVGKPGSRPNGRNDSRAPQMLAKDDPGFAPYGDVERTIRDGEASQKLAASIERFLARTGRHVLSAPVNPEPRIIMRPPPALNRQAAS